MYSTCRHHWIALLLLLLLLLLSINLIFLALESSWRWLLLGYFTTVLAIGLTLAGLFIAADCKEQLPFGKVAIDPVLCCQFCCQSRCEAPLTLGPSALVGQVYLFVLQQLMTGPAFLEMTDLESTSLPSSCVVIGFFASTCTLFLQVSAAASQFSPRSRGPWLSVGSWPARLC